MQMSNLSLRAGRTAVSHRNNITLFKSDNRDSFGYGSKNVQKFIKRRQILKASIERWGMLDLIKKSGIELSQEEKENMLIFGDIRGAKWADIERQKLIHEIDIYDDIEGR